MAGNSDVSSGDKALVLLQSLICYMRERNILSRADLVELRLSMEARLDRSEDGLACDMLSAHAAAREMQELDEYCGKMYGGKRRRRLD